MVTDDAGDFTVSGFIFRDFGAPDSPTNGDEIVWRDPVSNSSFHLERMDDGVVWFCITARDPATGKQRQLHVNLCSDAPVKVVLQELPHTEWDTPEIQKPKGTALAALTPRSYLLPPPVGDPARGMPHTLERVGQIAGPDLWAVRWCGRCLSKGGEWELEPMPSSRDDVFLERCRFATAEEALACWDRANARQQPGEE